MLNDAQKQEIFDQIKIEFSKKYPNSNFLGPEIRNFGRNMAFLLEFKSIINPLHLQVEVEIIITNSKNIYITLVDELNRDHKNSFKFKPNSLDKSEISEIIRIIESLSR